MPTFRRVLFSCSALIVAFSALACGSREPTPNPSKGAAPAVSANDVLATVNGVPIREVDVQLKLKSDMHTSEQNPLFRKNALDAIIRQELIRQKASELGLESDPNYQQKTRQLEAQLNAVKRTELGELFFRQQVAGKAAVSEEEAKKYFAENTARIQTELHVFQILWSKEDASVEQAKKDLDGGARFEDVARRHYPTTTTEQTPWDLGYMKWSQIPDSWRKPIEAMKPGEVSGIIHGPKNRTWIIKLVERRVNPEVTFESVKAPLIENLTSVKIEALREKSERELKEKAKIVYSATTAPVSSGEP